MVKYDTSKLIRSGDFCEVITEKFTDKDLKRGQLVYVAGAKALPISEEDPYTQRIKFFVHLVENNIVDTSQLYLMDANSLLKASVARQKKSTKLLREQVQEQLVEGTD